MNAGFQPSLRALPPAVGRRLMSSRDHIQSLYFKINFGTAFLEGN